MGDIYGIFCGFLGGGRNLFATSDAANGQICSTGCTEIAWKLPSTRPGSNASGTFQILAEM
eukprot:1536419-Prymnesium_polylepis.1